jgi:DNA-binding LacI/PurR family transcriptional regulator
MMAAGRRRRNLGLGGLLVPAALLLAAGCDPGGFVPPRPAELSGEPAPVAAPAKGSALPGHGGTAGAVPGSARGIELILAPCEPEEAEVLKSKARAMAGTEHFRIQIAVASQQGGEQSASALVRKAAARSPAALVVEPADPADPELARAIDEARGQGLTVVVMGRPLAPAKSPAGDESKAKEAARSAGAGRIITAVPEAFPGSARQLVDAALNNARNIGFAPDGGAVLVINTASDSMAADRTAAFRAALNAAGVSPVKELEFSGDIKDVRAKLAELIKGNHKIGMVLSNDHVGLTASFQALNDLPEGRSYVVAGYTTDESSARMTSSGEFAGAAVYAPERMVRKAIASAAAVARGEKVADRVELMVPVNLSPATSGAPKMYKRMAGPGPPPGTGKSPAPGGASPNEPVKAPR